MRRTLRTLALALVAAGGIVGAGSVPARAEGWEHEHRGGYGYRGGEEWREHRGFDRDDWRGGRGYGRGYGGGYDRDRDDWRGRGGYGYGGNGYGGYPVYPAQRPGFYGGGMRPW